MRPYLSIIKDSFRAATASRVLYVLLICITVLLVLLAPIWIKEELDWEIRSPQHVRNPDALAKRLAGDGPLEHEKLVHHIWGFFPANLQQDLTRFFEKDQAAERNPNPGQEDTFGEEGSIARQTMWNKAIAQLNRIITEETVYDAEVFSGRLLIAEAEGYIERGVDNLNDAQKRRLNRLLVERALGSAIIRSGPASSLTLSYAIWSPSFLKLNASNPEMRKTIALWLPYLLDKFVLAIGLLIAILITASIIPDMLQSSSLSLLLSKPISRWGLLLSKFAGGCAFVAILASYLFAGIWFLLGIRIGYWETAILLSIPVYVFAFAIYFSVSTLVGVLYRNTIVSIFLTLVFWGVCFGVGTVYYRFKSSAKAMEIVNVIEAKDDVFQVDRMAVPYRYDLESNQWQIAMADDATKMFSTIMYVGAFFQDPDKMQDIPPPIGPSYDPTHDAVVLGQFDMQRPQTMDRRKLTSSNDAMGWKPVNAGYMPLNAIQLFSSEKLGMLAVTGIGDFLQLSENPLTAADRAKQPAPQQPEKPVEAGAPSASQGAGHSAGPISKQQFIEQPASVDQSTGVPAATREPTRLDRPRIQSASTRQVTVHADEQSQEILNIDLFKRIGPNRRVDIVDARYVDFNPVNDEIAVYRNGAINLFEYKNGSYEFLIEIKPDLQVEPSMTAWLVYRGNTIFIGLGNGEIVTIARDTFQELQAYTPDTRSAIRAIQASDDGRWFTVIFRNGNMWLLDTEKSEAMTKVRVAGQGDISGAAFNAAGQLWVASNIDQITLYEPGTWRAIRSLKPKSSFVVNSYRYAVNPLYRAFPKPGEFYKLVSHLSSNSGVSYDRELDLTTQPEAERPWDPFRSGVIFMTLMLVISCFIFQRQEY